MAKKHSFRFLKSFFDWLKASRSHLFAALIVAAGMAASISVFAAGPEQPAECAPAVKEYMAQNDWDAESYTCNVDYSKNPNAPQSGAIAPNNFKSPAEFAAFARSNDPQAQKVREAASNGLSPEGFQDWLTGNHFVAIQVKEPTEIDSQVILDNGELVEENAGDQRMVASGDIFLLFVGDEEQEVSTASNPLVDTAHAKTKQVKHKKKKKPKAKPTTTGGTPTTIKGAKVVKPGNVRLRCGNPAVGLKRGKHGNLTIKKFDDRNGNGKLDKSEPGIGGVKIHVYRDNVGDVANGTTNSKGEFKVKNIHLNKFKVREEVPSGFKATNPNPTTVDIKDKCNCTLTFGNQKIPTIVTTPVPTPTPVIAVTASPTPTPSPSPSPTPAPTPTAAPACVEASAVSPSPTPGASPSPNVSPSPVVTAAAVPICSSAPIPQALPPGNSKPPLVMVQQAFSSLPKTGQAGLITFLTFLLASIVYYGGSRIGRRGPKS